MNPIELFTQVLSARKSAARATKHPRLQATFAVIVVLLAVHCVSAQQVGFVQELEGRWLLNNSQQLATGQSLPSGGVITNPSPAESDRIAIANTRGEIIARRGCKVPGECNKRITLPRAHQAPGVLSTAYNAVMGLIWGEPDRYTVTGVRSDELPDGVVEIKSQQLDLRPIFKGKENGRYYLRIVSIARAGSNAEQPITQIEFDWNRAVPQRASAASVRPGLYELKLLQRIGGNYMTTETNAWILVSDPARYAKANASFLKLLSLTRRWGEDVTPEAKRRFLRASLDKLASELFVAK